MVTVVENTDDRVHLTLPAPPRGHAELSDAEPSEAAGGTCTMQLPNREWMWMWMWMYGC